MAFEITVQVGEKHYKMLVTCVYQGDTIEKFEVAAGGKSITLQTDYHYLKKTGQRKKADWKIISGEVKSGVAFALTIRELERYFSHFEV